MRRSRLLVWEMQANREIFKLGGGFIAMESHVMTSQKPTLTW